MEDIYIRYSLLAQMVKNLPAMQKTLVKSLGQEDPWRRASQPTPVFLPGEFHGESMELQKAGHDWMANTLTLNHSHNEGLSIEASQDYCLSKPDKFPHFVNNISTT